MIGVASSELAGTDTMDAGVQQVPTRADVKPQDCWDLSSLYTSNEAWEADFSKFEQLINGYTDFKGRLSAGPEVLQQCLQFDVQVDRLAERLGTYAFLKSAEDQANNTYQALGGSVPERGGQGWPDREFPAA